MTAPGFGTTRLKYFPDEKVQPGCVEDFGKAVVTTKELDRERALGRYAKQDILGVGCDNR